MRVLVTGGSGFIGSHVVDKLRDQGQMPVIFDLQHSPYHSPDEVETILGSVTDPETLELALSGCDAVIHLAAIADVNDVLKNPAHSENVNSSGTFNVLEAARTANVGKVVYGSTIWAYSDCEPDEVDEDTPLAAPSHFYTATKLAGEMYCKSYAELYGIEYTILRFGIPYGPRAREAAVVPAFTNKAFAGEPLTIAGDGKQYRRFVYVEDLADGIVAGLLKGKPNRVYNLAGDETVTILEIAETIRNVIGDVEIVHTEARAGDFGGKYVSSERAERELDWTAATPFAEGVTRYVEWRKETAKQAAARQPRPATVAASSKGLEADDDDDPGGAEHSGFSLDGKTGSSGGAAKSRSSDGAPERVLVMTADIGAGHDLPARRISEQLKQRDPDVEVETVDALAAMGKVLQKLMREGSDFNFRHLPWLFDIQYFLLMRVAPVRWLTLRLAVFLYGRRMLKLIRKHRPDAVVSTYPGATALIGELRRRRRLEIPCYSAITDLAGLHFWAHPGIDQHFVTHPESIPEVEQIAGEGSAVWAQPPSDPRFLEERSQADARAALDLPAEGKLIVVSGGGWAIGDLGGAIETALQAEDATIVCLCGNNQKVRDDLAKRFEGEPRLRLWGFTDEMPDILAAADLLIHSTAGLTVLEAIIRGCPVISYGFGAGHVKLNNRALEHFGLAQVAHDREQLADCMTRALARHPAPDLGFADLPEPASFVRVRDSRTLELPAWRTRLGRASVSAVASFALITALFAVDDSYTLVSKAFHIKPTRSVQTDRHEVGLIVDAPQPLVPTIARQLSREHRHASFVMHGKPSVATLDALASSGDEPVPQLGRGGPVRWIGTRFQLRNARTRMGLGQHFYYEVPGKGFTLGQYLLGRASGAKPLTPAVTLDDPSEMTSLSRGDLLQVQYGDDPATWRAGLRTLDDELDANGMRAIPVGTLLSRND